jgi:hypothetical protein
MFINKTMSNEITIINIINDIESGLYDYKDIMNKYNITRYKYDVILKKYSIKNMKVKRGPKKTHFKDMLERAESDKKDIDEKNFDLSSFSSDCEEGMKLSELMEKYSLSLYQVRELRKRYDLKTK